MNRKEFLTGAAACMGTVFVPASARAATTAEEGTIKRIVQDLYHTYSVAMDREKYRAMLAHDYLLLENGEIMDRDGDVGLMPAPDSGYQRTDAFEFRSVQLQGDTAWAVYTLRSDINDPKNGARHRDYLESMVLRRTGDRWLVTLLHSTRIVPPAQ